MTDTLIEPKIDTPSKPTHITLEEAKQIEYAGAEIGHNDWLIKSFNKGLRLALERDNNRKLHPAILPYKTMLFIAEDKALEIALKHENIQEIQKKLTEIFHETKNSLKDWDSSQVDIINTMFEGFVKELTDINKIRSWIDSLKQNWLPRNELWGRDGHEFANMIIRQNNINANIELPSALDNSFFEDYLPGLKNRLLDFIDKLSTKDALEFLVGNRDLLLLSVIAHWQWRKRAYAKELSNSIKPDEMYDILLGLNKFERDNLKEIYEGVKTRAHNMVYNIKTSGLYDSTEDKKIVEMVRSIFEKDRANSALESFLLIFALADLFKSDNPDLATNIIKEISYDLNPAIIDSIQSISKDRLAQL